MKFVDDDDDDDDEVGWAEFPLAALTHCNLPALAS